MPLFLFRGPRGPFLDGPPPPLRLLAGLASLSPCLQPRSRPSREASRSRRQRSGSRSAAVYVSVVVGPDVGPDFGRLNRCACLSLFFGAD